MKVKTPVKWALSVLCLGLIVSLMGCELDRTDNASTRDSAAALRQQDQYSKVQPVPQYDWSLERDIVIQLYNIRNLRAATHSVWRSDFGQIEGDCPSIGFGMPYDTSLTNPLVATRVSESGYEHDGTYSALTSIEQPEPNGVFASKNTAATWVLCAGENAELEPIYVETKVTAYPYPVQVDYDKNRVTKAGKATVTIKNTK